MRDLDRVRDKIEIRLEPRQVVMLAIGTMVFSGLLFAAGFMLGRSRAPVPSAPTLALGGESSAAIEVADRAVEPVQAAAIGEVTFQFPSMLGSRPGQSVAARAPMRLKADVVSVAAGEGEDRPAEPAPEVKPAPAPVPAPEVRPAPTAKLEPAPAPKPAPKPAPVEPPARPEPVAARAPAAIEPIDEDDPDAAPPPARAPAPPPAASDDGDPRYTLQVKAARDKAEADAFIAELRAAGFEPHVVLADIPGKGRFFRVRVGRFASMAEARAFQRRYKVKSGQPDGGFVTDL